MERNYFDEPDYPFFDQVKKCIILYANLSLGLLLTFFLIRLTEFVYIGISKQFPPDSSFILPIALFYDLLFWAKILPFLFIPFFVLYFIFRYRKYNLWSFAGLGMLFIIAYLCLIKYYVTALVPLGSDLFGYSFDEIMQTIGAGTSFDIASVAGFIVIPAFFLSVTFFLYKRMYLNGLLSIAVLIFGVLVNYINISLIPDQVNFSNDFSYNLSLNKEAFFIEKTGQYFNKPEAETDIYAINYLEDKSNQQGNSYAGYPFVHKDVTPDVLGEFFTIDSANAPSIVFIQVEGLGRAFSGTNAYLGSFTPFLDKLAGQSLYWKNFLASQGRTFASLPSVLGSLPFGDNGFTDMGGKMPAHFTLYNILQKNGYDTRFYSGFDPKFDNESDFLKKQGVNLIIGESDYDKAYVKSPATAGFSWGYADRELMRKTLASEISLNRKVPSLSYIQTVSMHTPYTIPEQNQYLKKFEEHLTKLGFSESKKNEYRKYKNIYSSVLYSDAALEYFFKNYSKLPAFKNTIFIITGDHRLPEIPMSTKIDRYHVPLLIYSPLLKKTASFKSISSHLDIAPSILAFLKHNYKIKTPEVVTWVGSGIDTARNLRNIHRYPLKQTKTELVNYVSGLYFIDQDVLFTIHDNLDIEPIRDDEKLMELKSEFNRYISANNSFIQSGKLMPDSVFYKFKAN